MDAKDSHKNRFEEDGSVSFLEQASDTEEHPEKMLDEAHQKYERMAWGGLTTTLFSGLAAVSVAAGTHLTASRLSITILNTILMGELTCTLLVLVVLVSFCVGVAGLVSMLKPSLKIYPKSIELPTKKANPSPSPHSKSDLSHPEDLDTSSLIGPHRVAQL